MAHDQSKAGAGKDLGKVLKDHDKEIQDMLASIGNEDDEHEVNKKGHPHGAGAAAEIEAAGHHHDEDVVLPSGIASQTDILSSLADEEDDFLEDDLENFVPYNPEQDEEGLEDEEEEGEEEGEGSTKSASSSAKPEQKFKIRPKLEDKFRPGPVQHCIEKSIRNVIGDKPYTATEAPEWSKQIVQEILDQTKAMRFDRFKLIAQAIIGERNGQGTASAQRFLWDTESDCYASYTYTRDSLFCIGIVYAVYFY